MRTFISSALLRRAHASSVQKRVDAYLKELRDFHLKDIEQRVRAHALAEGTDDREMLEQLVELSNERRAVRGRDENLNEEGADHGF